MVSEHLSTRLAFLFLAATTLGCRSGSAPDDSTVAQAVPPADPEQAQVNEVFDEPFVFTIDGMRKINGAL